MAIQVSSSVHAAITLYVVPPAPPRGIPAPLARDEPQFLQSPQGCIMQRIPGDGPSEGEPVYGWLIFLDYGLDSGSTALACTPFLNDDDPPTGFEVQPIIPVLFHIDDRVKLLVTLAYLEGEWRAVNQSFHAIFFNYQANRQELYPVDLGTLPRTRSLG